MTKSSKFLSLKNQASANIRALERIEPKTAEDCGELAAWRKFLRLVEQQEALEKNVDKD